jgi:hypothetical protein
MIAGCHPPVRVVRNEAASDAFDAAVKIARLLALRTDNRITYFGP